VTEISVAEILEQNVCDKTFRNGKKQETGSGNALVGAYLNTLGLTDEAIVFITSAAPDDVEFLSFQKAETLNRIRKYIM
jgi:hypothetical protein